MILVKEFPKLKKIVKEDEIKYEIKSMAYLLKSILPSVFQYDQETCFFKKLSNGIIFAHLINIILPNSLEIKNKIDKRHEFKFIKTRIFLEEILCAAKKINISLINIGAEDIVNGKQSSILGLLFQLTKLILEKEEYQYLKNNLDISSTKSNVDLEHDDISRPTIKYTIIENNFDEYKKKKKEYVDNEISKNVDLKKLTFYPNSETNAIDYLTKSYIIDWINNTIKHARANKNYSDIRIKNLSSDLSDSIVYFIILESIAGNILGEVTKLIREKNLYYRAERIVSYSHILGFSGSISSIDIRKNHEETNFIFLKQLYKKYWRNEIKISAYTMKYTDRESVRDNINVLEKLHIIDNDMRILNKKVNTLIKKLEMMNMSYKKGKEKRWYKKIFKCLFGNCY
ncbi:Plastin-2 [Astathelohania contejeani]|uniref:Plastin-2 n=1 Tax=Astathelohania contejeani TaxID=164912 RepID=A0ABQ7HW67_9MICR|nr:Plastin-2 [Thelohania contejeani]